MSEEILNIVNEEIDPGAECVIVEASDLAMALAAVRMPFDGEGVVALEAGGGRCTMRRTDRVVAAEASIACEGSPLLVSMTPALVAMATRLAAQPGRVSIFRRGAVIVISTGSRFAADHDERASSVPSFWRLDLDRDTTWVVRLAGRHLQRIAQTASMYDDAALDIEVGSDDAKAAKLTLVCGGQLSKRISARWWLSARW